MSTEHHIIELASAAALSERTALISNATGSQGSQGEERKQRWRWVGMAGAVLGLVAVLTVVSVPLAKEGRKIPNILAASASHSASDLQGGPGFFEGDLYHLPTTEVAQAYGQQAAARYARKYGLRLRKDALIADANRLWSGGVFYYAYDAGLTQTAKTNFQTAMAHVKANVPRVTFIERTGQTFYTTILTPVKGCYSTSVGRADLADQPQSIGLVNTCTAGNSIHEIMHAMGFWHEQTRPDRDTWVTIHNANIEAGKSTQFERRQAWETNDRGSPYDYGSIMHYPSWAFSSNGQDTITKNVNKGPTMGQRDGMSWEDKFQMNAVYPNCDMRVNIAQGKSAFQSSTYHSAGVASHAVDGNTNGQYGSNSCTHTQSSQFEWWAVDLGATSDVCSVSLTNRADCCSERLVNFDIFVSDRRPADLSFRPTSAELCVRAKNTFSGTKTFSCEGVKRGRYLGVQLRGANTALTLCEVQAYGPPPTCSTSTIAQGKSAFQSSTYHSAGVASHAVDGNTNGQYGSNSCTHTQSSQFEWWAVDLGAATNVCGVVITNRADCCSERLTNFDIFVTNRRPDGSGFRPTDAELCRRLPASFTFTGTQTFDCVTGKTGRYVGVQIREAQPLTLCELQVRTQG